jgi:adhesin transport system outer membrane protein
MKKFNRIAWLAAFILTFLLSYSVANGARAEDKDEAAQMQMSDYLQLKRFTEIPSASRVAQSNLRQQEIILAALNYSPTARELLASLLAAGLDTTAAKGVKLPQVTATVQSVMTEGDLAMASKNRGSPGATLQATYVVYDWGRLDANVKVRKEAEFSLNARQNLVARQVALDVTTTCLEFSKQRALLTANIDYVSKIKDLVRRLNRVVESDPGRAGELVQTKSRMLQADSSIETVRTKITEVKYRLDRILGPNQSHKCEGLGPSLMNAPEQNVVLESLKIHPQIRIVESDYRQNLSLVEQLAATRKPQASVIAAHAPVSLGFTQDYAQSVSLSITAPLFDGNTLKSSERASLERANAALERKEETLRQLTDDVKQRHSQAKRNLARAEEYVSLLEINKKVRDDFFVQWVALGRRSLFELLAIEAEQFSLDTGYFTALFDGMAGVAYLRAAAGELTVEITPSN